MRKPTVLMMVTNWIGKHPYARELADEIHQALSRKDQKIEELKSQLKIADTRKHVS